MSCIGVAATAMHDTISGCKGDSKVDTASHGPALLIIEFKLFIRARHHDLEHFEGTVPNFLVQSDQSLRNV